jgi:hypothetical protein
MGEMAVWARKEFETGDLLVILADHVEETSTIVARVSDLAAMVRVWQATYEMLMRVKNILLIGDAFPVGQSVPYMLSFSSMSELERFYEPFGGKITSVVGTPSRFPGQEDVVFVVRLPRQRRIHFYAYNAGNLYEGSFVFKSEGFYDHHSPYYMGDIEPEQVA